MTGRIFLDTNLWVYLFSEDIEKGGEVARLIGYNFGNVRVCPQVLSELFNVLTKNLFKQLIITQEVKNGRKQRDKTLWFCFPPWKGFSR